MMVTELKLDEKRVVADKVTTTTCPYCGVGCNLELHVQDNRIVKATSPLDHDVTRGHLCIKGRFGWEHVQPAAACISPAVSSTSGLGKR